MHFKEFLILTHQLSSKKRATFVVDGYLVAIEATNKKNCWKISTKICHVENPLSSTLQDCLRGTDLFRWNRSGPFLMQDPSTGSIYLVKEIEMPLGKFIPFRHHLNAFQASISEWCDTIKAASI
jgi:hypothetical protein